MGFGWSSAGRDDSVLSARLSALSVVLRDGGRMTDVRRADRSMLSTFSGIGQSLCYLIEAELECFEQRLVRDVLIQYHRKGSSESNEAYFLAQMRDRRELETHICPVCGATLMGRASWLIHIVHAHHPTHPLRRKDVGPWTDERALRYCGRYDKLEHKELECLRDNIAMRRQRDLWLGYREQLLSDIHFRKTNNSIEMLLPDLHLVSAKDVGALIPGHPDILARTLSGKVDVAGCTIEELMADMTELLDNASVQPWIGTSWCVKEQIPLRDPFPDRFVGLRGEPFVMMTRFGGYWHSYCCSTVQSGTGTPTRLCDAEHTLTRACMICRGRPFYVSARVAAESTDGATLCFPLKEVPFVMATPAGKYWHSMYCPTVKSGIRIRQCVAERTLSRACKICCGKPFYVSAFSDLEQSPWVLCFTHGKEQCVMTTPGGNYWHSRECRFAKSGTPTRLCDAERSLSRACKICGGDPFLASVLNSSAS